MIILIIITTGISSAETSNTSPAIPTGVSGLAHTTDVGIHGSFTPQTAETGTPFTAGNQLFNLGPEHAEDIQIDYYLVPFNETNARPIWLHQKTTEVIPAFYDDVVSFTTDLPGGINPGLYTLLTTISTKSVDRNLSNNQYISHTPIQIKRSLNPRTDGQPDLSVTIDDANPNETAPGYPFTIHYSVFNTGNGSSGTFHVGFYLSPDQIIEPSDIRIWDEVYYSSWPGMAETGSATDIIPSKVQPGSYYLGSIIDFTHMVNEGDEEKNTAVFEDPITIADKKPPVDEKFLSQVSGYIALKTNIYRQYRGLENLTYDPDLSDIARQHSIDMALRNYFAHESPEGTDPSGRADAAKYDNTKRLPDGTIRTGLAENIVKISAGNIIGEGYSGFVDPSNPEAVADVMMIEWISSPEHNKNLVTETIDRIGVGVAYNGEYFYGTQNFI